MRNANRTNHGFLQQANARRAVQTRRGFLKSAMAGSAAAALASASLRAEPISGGTLRVAKSQPVNTLDSRRVAGFAYNETGWQNYSSYVYLEPDGSASPALFNGWQFMDDGSRVVFTITPDVKFHDGTPFNAEAAKWNFDRIINPDTRAHEYQLGPLAQTRVIDHMTIEMRYDTPHAEILQGCSAHFSHR